MAMHFGTELHSRNIKAIKVFRKAKKSSIRIRKIFLREGHLAQMGLQSCRPRMYGSGQNPRFSIKSFRYPILEYVYPLRIKFERTIENSEKLESLWHRLRLAQTTAFERDLGFPNLGP